MGKTKTKRTEKGVLEKGRGLDDTGSSTIISKMKDKGQTFKRARDIARETEEEAGKLLAKITDEDQKRAIRKAIEDYVSSSTAIQTRARDWDTDSQAAAAQIAVTALDAALRAIRDQIDYSDERIVYRSITYTAVDQIPYGLTVDGNNISVGDYVGDKGFLSTSEHRQFILGTEQTETPPALLKLGILSKTGVPIAIKIGPLSYTNDNLKLIYDDEVRRATGLEKAMKKVFGGPSAGQAEVLFPRDTVFEVKKISRSEDKNEVNVTLEEHEGTRPGTVKNMKYGSPL